MSYATNVTTPVKMMVAILMGVSCVILIIASMAATGVFGASTSTALITTQTDMINSLPYVGLILASGLVYFAMDHGRR